MSGKDTNYRISVSILLFIDKITLYIPHCSRRILIYITHCSRTTLIYRYLPYLQTQYITHYATVTSQIIYGPAPTVFSFSTVQACNSSICKSQWNSVSIAQNISVSDAAFCNQNLLHTEMGSPPKRKRPDKRSSTR